MAAMVGASSAVQQQEEAEQRAAARLALERAQNTAVKVYGCLYSYVTPDDLAAHIGGESGLRSTRRSQPWAVGCVELADAGLPHIRVSRAALAAAMRDASVCRALAAGILSLAAQLSQAPGLSGHLILWPANEGGPASVERARTACPICAAPSALPLAVAAPELWAFAAHFVEMTRAALTYGPRTRILLRFA